jgi:hypothetical protein
MKTKFISLGIAFLFTINIFSQRAININNTFTNDTVLNIFYGIPAFYAFRVQCSSTLPTDTSLVRIILKDIYGNELLVYEDYALIHNEYFSGVNNFGEETFYLPLTTGDSVIIQTNNASVYINQFIYYTKPFSGYIDLQKAHIDSLTNRKADEMNNKVKQRQMLWFAGNTSFSSLPYIEKESLFGEKHNLEGWDYYDGGIFVKMSQINNVNKSVGTLVEDFDWRKKHNANDSSSPYFDGDPDSMYYGSSVGWVREHGNGWLTGIKDQTCWGACNNGCYAFSTVTSVEAVINLYFNQHLNYDLSEQEAISCGYYHYGNSCGTCWSNQHIGVPHGGDPNKIAQLIRDYGISGESCFPWADSMVACSNKCDTPEYVLKISNYTPFSPYYIVYQSDKIILKQNLINYGPHQVSIGTHSQSLVGWGKLKEGQVLVRQYDTIVVNAGNPLIGANYWTLKNSAGPTSGDHGYSYFIDIKDENPSNILTYMHSVFRINTPILGLSDTIRCADLDGDGYYNWGIGPKPATCPTCPDEEDGNDADPMMGPYDANYYCTCNCSYIPPYPNSPIEVSQNTTWDDYRYINKDVIIDSGATLIINAKIGFRRNRGIEVQNGGILILNDGSYLYSICDTTWGGITVDGGGTLITNNNSIIALYGNGKVFIDSSSNGVGRFYYNKGSYLSLTDDSTYIDIKGNLYIGDSANFNFTGNGYVRFSSTLNPSKNIFYGSGSSITLTGSGQSDKIMEIAQETVFMPNCTLSNGLVYMQHPNARMQAASENTSMFLDNVKFSPLGTTRTQHRGVNVWGNQNCTISNCIFENGQYGIYAYLSYGGTSLSVSNCNFTNNTYGMWVHDKSFNSSTCTFTKNDYGIYAENTSVNNSKIDNCYFTGNPNRNKYPIRYMNCDGGLSIENTQIYDADATSLYSINSSGNYNLRLYCTTVSVPGTNTYALNLANGANLIMSTNTSRSGNCNITAAAPIRLTNAYNINIDNGYNYLNKSGSYHIYGNITAYACNGMPSLYFRNNQWNGTITNLVKNNNCSPSQNFTLITNPTATYTSCNNKSLIIENNETTQNSVQIINYADDAQDWQNEFNTNAQLFNGSFLEENPYNVQLLENSWENMRYCLKKMYGLKQLNGISNSEFNQTILANHKMQQLQKDNYYRLFQLKLEKVTLYRMAGDYDKAIELVEKLTSDTCSSHKEQADAWLCMLQLEKRIAQGLIPPDRIEKERVNCPMFQEPVDEQIKSFQNNSSEINSESSSWIKIVPNPASEQVTLCVNSESENPCEIEITNVLGEHVETISIAEGYSETVVSLDKYSKGIYIASLIKNGRKVIIERFSVVK